MLVDLVRLRDHGRKLSPGQLADVLPLRGELTIEISVSRNQHAETVRSGHAHLRDAHGHDLVPFMTSARIDSLRGDQFVVVGTEVVDPMPKAACWSGPQAWACTAVSAAGESQ